MHSIQPEQASFLLQMSLAGLKNEHGITKNIIEAVPVDKGDYRVAAESRSAIDLAWHIVAAENMFLDAVASGAFTFPSGKPDNIRTSADVSAWYAAEFEKNTKRLAGRSGDELAKILDFRGLFQLPAVFYLQFGVNHTIHHRGQLSVYLRPMGAKVPSIYGESYDATQARKAAGG